MRTIIAKPGMTLPLGREGENLAREILFDVDCWRKLYGNGTVQLIASRSGEQDIYPVTITMRDNFAVWPVSRSDTALKGRGCCELQYYSGETLVKSETWTTYVADAMGEPTGDPPEPYQSWVDDVLEAGNAAAESAARAEEATTKNPKISDRGTWLIWSAAEGKYIDTGVSAVGSGVELDTTLSVSGKAADARAVGEVVEGIMRGHASAWAELQDRIIDDEIYYGDKIDAEVARATQAEADLKQQITQRYSKPADGIPEEDLSAAVQTKLNQGGGSGGTTDHAQLTNRDAADQHPMSAITGLAAALAAKANDADLAAVAKSGSYNDLGDKPTIPAAVTDAHINSLIDTKIGNIESALQSMVDTYGGVLA